MKKVVHFELPVEDMERAQKFYEEAFDWHLVDMPEMKYKVIHSGPTDDSNGMLKDKGYINGGMFQRTAELQHPNIVVDVGNIDACAKKIQELGGSIIQEKQEVGEMGYVAYFKDLDGNLVGIWENK